MEWNGIEPKEEKMCVCLRISSFGHLTHLLTHSLTQSVRDDIPSHAHTVSFRAELTDVQLKDPPFRQFKEDRSAINSFYVSSSVSSFTYTF